MHRQLASELAPRDGRRGLVISASKELEPGVRAMLVLAEGLFRIDVVVRGDSLQTVVRNLTAGPVQMWDVGQSEEVGSIVLGEAAALGPGRAHMGFVIGSGDDRLMVKVTLATLRFEQRGTFRISAQAVLRVQPLSRPPGKED